MSTVYPSLEESKGNEGSIWLIGTIVHYDSALQAIYDGYLDAQEKTNLILGMLYSIEF